MRFLMLVKHGENPGPPPPEFLEAMAKLDEDAAKSGHDDRERGAGADIEEHAGTAFSRTGDGD